MGNVLNFIAVAVGVVLLFVPGMQYFGVALIGLGAAGMAVSAREAMKEAEEAMAAAQNKMRGLQITSQTSQTVVPLVYGRQMAGGNIVYRWCANGDSGVPNGNMDMVLGLGEGEIDAVEEVWFDDILVWLYGSKTGSKFKDNFTFDWRPGTASQTCFDWMTVANPDFTDTYAYTAVAGFRLVYKQEVYPGIPKIQIVIRGKKCLDPRDSVTRWTQTGPLQFRDMLSSARYGGGIAAGNIDDVAIIEEANYCDEVVLRDTPLAVTGEPFKNTGSGKNWTGSGQTGGSGEVAFTAPHLPIEPGSVSVIVNGGGELGQETLTEGAGISVDYGTGAITGASAIPNADFTVGYRSGTRTFTYYPLYIPLVAGSVSVNVPGYTIPARSGGWGAGSPTVVPAEVFSDNGAGVLTGDHGGTGTVNYATGAISVTLSRAPMENVVVTCGYSSDRGPRFACSWFGIDSSPVLDQVRDLLSHFLGVLLYANGKYSVAIEKPDVTVFDLRSGGAEDSGNNIVDGSFAWKMSGNSSVPSAIRGKWTNPAERWAVKDKVVEVESVGSRREVSMNLLGITDHDVLERILYTHRSLALLGTACTLKTTLKGLPLQPLSLVRVTHPAAGWTTKTMRVSAVSDSIKDEEVALDLVEYDPNAYVDQPPTTVIENHDTPPKPTDTPPYVTGLTLTEVVREGADGTVYSFIAISFVAPADYPYVDAYEIFVRTAEDADFRFYGDTRATTYEFGPARQGVPVSIRVSVRSVSGIRYEDNAVEASITPDGKTDGPGAPAFTDASCVFTDRVYLVWGAVADADVAYYEVRTDLNWGQVANRVYFGVALSCQLLGASSPLTFYIKAINRSGNYSTAYDTQVVTNAAPSAPTGVTLAFVGRDLSVTWTLPTEADYQKTRIRVYSNAGRTTLLRTEEVSGNAWLYSYEKMNVDFASVRAADGTYTVFLRLNHADVLGSASGDVDASILCDVPPSPVLSSIMAGFAQATIRWDLPTALSWDTTQVFRSITNDSNTAVQVYEGRGIFFTDTGLTPGTQYFYWLRSKSVSGTVSGFDASRYAGHAVTPVKIDGIDLEDGIITVDKLATGMQPVYYGTSLPPLPDDNYPEGVFFALSTDNLIYISKGDHWEVSSASMPNLEDLPGHILDTQISDDTISTRMLQANSVNANKLLIGSPGGVINTDPYFLDATAWSLGGATIADVTDGKAGLKAIQASGVGAVPWDAKTYPVDVGKKYVMRLWARKENTGNGVLYGVVRIYDADGNDISGNGTYFYPIGIVAVSPPAVFTEYVGILGAASLPIPSTARTMRVGLLLNYGATQGWMQVQGVRLEEWVPTTLIEDGAITTEKILAGAITAGKLYAGAVQADKISATHLRTDVAIISVSAQIANAIIENAHISDLNASKINAGTIDAARLYITSQATFGAGYDPTTKETPAGAQAKADSAQAAATAVANAAQGSANTANALLADIASDSKLTPVEKSATKKEWDAILTDYSTLDAQAATYGITTERTNLTNAYNALNAYLNAGSPSLLSNLSTTSDIVGATFRANFKAYYDAGIILLNTIVVRARALAESTAAADATSKANTVAAASLDKVTYLTAGQTTIAGGRITTRSITSDKVGDVAAGNGTVITSATVVSRSEGPSPNNYWTPKIMKEITVNRGTGLRITFSGEGHSGFPSPILRAHFSIYRNGVAVGTERTWSNAVAGYMTWTEDITGWSPGDRVQIYSWFVYNNTPYPPASWLSGGPCLIYLSNFSISFIDPLVGGITLE